MTIKGIILTLITAVFGWFCVMVAVMYFTDAAPGAVVVFPSDQVMANLGDVSVVSVNRVSVTLTSTEDRFAKRLYANGAKLVLPAGLVGCLPLPGTKPKASQYTK